MAPWTSLWILAIFLLNLCVSQSDAVKCYQCSSIEDSEDSEYCQTPNNKTSTCDDDYCSVFAMDIDTDEGTKTITVRDCESGDDVTMCFSLDLYGTPFTACTCKNSLCNAMSTSTAVTAPTTPATGKIGCYSCTYDSTEDDDEKCEFPDETTDTCRGDVCLKVKAKYKGETAITRGCAAGSIGSDKASYSESSNGLSIKTSVCTSDMCNAASSHTAKFLPMAMIFLALYILI